MGYLEFFAAVILVLSLVGAILFVLRGEIENKRRPLIFITIGLAAFSWLVGAFGGIAEKLLHERTEPVATAVPTIAKIELGYPEIVLDEYDELLSDDQIKNLSEIYTAKDSILLSEDFVSEFNELASDSGFVSQAISRRYSGKEFFALFSGGLTAYGRSQVWSQVARSWASELGKIPVGDGEGMRAFTEEVMPSFIQGAGIVNNAVASIMRGDATANDEIFSCSLDSQGIVKRQVDNTDHYSIGFLRWRLPLSYHFGEKERSLEYNRGIAEVIDRGCTDKLRQFMIVAAESVEREREIIRRLIGKVNTYLKVATPSSMSVTAVVLNSGRFGAAVSAESKLIFRDNILKTLNLVADKSKRGRYVFSVPSREVREIDFSVTLPSEDADRYAQAFRSATTDVELQIQLISSGKKSEIRSSPFQFKK